MVVVAGERLEAQEEDSALRSARSRARHCAGAHRRLRVGKRVGQLQQRIGMLHANEGDGAGPEQAGGGVDAAAAMIGSGASKPALFKTTSITVAVATFEAMAPK